MMPSVGRSALLALAVLASVLIAGPAPAQATKARRELKTITVAGDGYSRGRMHGEQLKAEVAAIVATWKAGAAATASKDADEVLRDFFEYASFETTIETWTPDLLAEVRGIADGSGQEFEDVFVLNLLDEFWVYLDRLQNHHCSALGVPAHGGQPARVAQNMDLENYTDGFQVLMRIEGSDGAPEQLVLTHAGLIALNGVNDARIAVCVNTLMQLEARPDGLPVAFVIRGLLARHDRDAVLKFVREVPHASGQNYILGIADDVFDFEASANKVVRFRPDHEYGRVYHTNHPLVNDDIKPWFVDREDGAEGPRVARASPNSARRFAALANRIGTGRGDVDADAIEDALRSKDDATHPICRPRTHLGRIFTFASVVMSLGETPTLRLAVGPPDEGDYLTFGFGGGDGK